MLGGMGHHKQVHSAPEGADVNLGAWLVGLFFFKKCLYLLIWLPKVLVLSCRLFSCGKGDLVL